MAKIIEFNGENIEFPDDMPDDQIEAVLQQQAGAVPQPQQVTEVAAAPVPGGAEVDVTQLKPHEMTDEQVAEVGRKTGVRPYNGIGSGIIDTVKDVFTGGEQAKGQGAGLPEIWSAEEMTTKPVFSDVQGDTLDEMLGSVKEKLKANAGIATASIFGGDADAVKIAKEKGAKIVQDDKGNLIAQFPSGDYIINKPGVSATDLGQTIAQTAPYLLGGELAAPLAAGKSLGARMALNAATDTAVGAGLGNAVEAAGGEDYSMGDALTQAGMSAGTTGLMGGVGRAAKAAFGGGPKMTESAAELINAADEMGVPLRTTELARAGEIGPQNRVTNALHYMSDLVSGPGKGVEALNEARTKIPMVLGNADEVARYSDEAMIDALSAGRQARINKAGAEFEAVKGDMGEQAIPLNNTIAVIDKTLDKWKKPGNVSADPTDIAKLENYRDRLMAGPQDLVMLREGRTALRQDLGSAMNKQLGKGEVDKAGKKIYDAMTKDMHEGVAAYGKPDSLARLKKADRDWGEMMDDLQATKISAAIKQGDLNPEWVRENLSRMGSGDLKKIDRMLNPEGRKTLQTAVTKNLHDAIGAGDVVNPAAFTKAYDQHKDVIDKFFDPKQAEQLAGIRKLMDTAKGMKLANVNLSNGSILLPYIMGGALLSSPIKGASVYGASKLYNSIPVRNALLKLAATKPASMRYNHIVRQLEGAVQAQVQRDEAKGR